MNDLVNYSIPAFVILIAAEVAITAWQQRDHYEAKDSASSITMGIGSVIVGFVGKAFALAAYTLVYQFRLFTIDMAQVWPWIVLFFAEDFSYYWFHRISHGSRWFWASHVVHHSSQKYNLSTAVRQTWTGTITGSFIFWLWLPLIGFSPLAIMTMQSISLLYQFWIHTELINRFPAPIEWVFNTPSHHRVHHGSDLTYLDKNHAGVLIIWDRLFGTFEPEQHRPTYGLTKNVGSYNPVKIAFHEWEDIARDLRHAGSLRNALGYLFGPPGWSHDGSRKTTKELRQLSVNNDQVSMALQNDRLETKP
ncbi:sterol desaturase family protein [uncultured Fibrella sp.]|uniref:sterol desaturase family protein n=1 Tax=uncultured Fibrella sp. TaxID=1284596 RepID=UPI0035C9DF4E